MSLHLLRVGADSRAGTSSAVHEAAADGAVNDLKAVLLLDSSLLDARDEFVSRIITERL